MSLIVKMAKTYQAERLSQDKIIGIQNSRLKKLVNYARNYSPFYQELYKDLDNEFNLSDLPVVTKSQMMASFDDVLTDRNITMNKINEFTKNLENIGHKIDGKYLVFKTSGSTGIPATVLYDDNMIDVSSAVAAIRTFAGAQECASKNCCKNEVMGLFNMSDEEQTFTVSMPCESLCGEWTDINGSAITITVPTTTFTLPAWQYLLLTR